MTIWSGLGMNYGHNFSVGTYDATVVESDLTFLKSQGITRLRIAAPTYNGAMLANCQDMVLRALAHGFYVIWGVATGATSPNLTATIWATYKPVVTATIAPWAQAHGLSELMIGNECDFEADGSTLTAATVRSDVRTMCVTVKSGGYTGIVSYDTAAQSAIITPWASEGIGTLDRIGWNNYNGSVASFTSFCTTLFTDFGSSSYISEFGSKGGGFSDFNDENLFASDTISRINAMQTAGFSSGYFFCYKDGGFGLSPDTFALVQASGIAHCVRGAILNTPGQAILSTFGVHA